MNTVREGAGILSRAFAKVPLAKVQTPFIFTFFKEVLSMFCNYISLTVGTFVVSVKPDNTVQGQKYFDIVIDGEDSHCVITVKKEMLKKLHNILRNVCYPRESDEKVKVCLNATASKSALDNLQSGGATSAATMATFLKSLRLEDVVFGGTTGSAENFSQTQTNLQE